MNRKFCYILLSIFLAMQIFSVLHMAEHGFKKHEHNGHLCSVYMHSEQSHAASLPTPPAPLPLPVADATGPLADALVLVSADKAGGNRQRAPPAA